eukprot:Em1323g1a
MIEVAKPLLNRHLIVGCGVGGYNSSTFKVHPLNINGWVGKYLDERPALTHTMATVDCFNLPPNIANGSKATISYRTIHGGEVLGVVSERPLVLSETTASRPCKIAACLAVAYGRPPFLDNWLRYQKSIGVTHVHVIAEPSFVSEGASAKPLAKRTQRSRRGPVRNGLCLWTFGNRTLPAASISTTIPSSWLTTTASIVLPHCRRRCPSRSAFTGCAGVVEVGIHDARELVPGFETVEVPTWEGYVAHLRKHRLPSDGKCF